NEYGLDPGNRDIENHSRVLRWDGRTNEWSVYNIPGDQNIVYAVGWDKKRRRVWLAQNGSLLQPKLIVFNPDSPVLRNNDVAFVTPTTTCDPVLKLCRPLSFDRACVTDADCRLAEQVCPPDSDLTPRRAKDCFLEYPLPADFQTAWISSIEVHPHD